MMIIREGMINSILAIFLHFVIVSLCVFNGKVLYE